MYKIYEKNNYVVVESIIPKETFYGHKKEVFIDKSNLDKPTYRIFNVRDLKDGLVLEIGQIQKENGDLYTESEFDTFYTENTGNSIVSQVLNNTGTSGVKTYKIISTASTNENVVKASGGNLGSIIAIGLTSDVRFLKLYNKATTPILATDVPKLTIPIPANTQGAGIAISFNDSIDFDLGIGIAITSGSADDNTGAVGAGDVIVNLIYA
jgi:hypothetical protein